MGGSDVVYSTRHKNSIFLPYSLHFFSRTTHDGFVLLQVQTNWYQHSHMIIMNIIMITMDFWVRLSLAKNVFCNESVEYSLALLYRIYCSCLAATTSILR